jgi:predicted lipid-binding transport protein (Tim44 family)
LWLVKPAAAAYCRFMVTRAQLLILGLTAGVMGSLVGGLMLGIGLGLVVNSVHAGWILVLPAAPLSGLLGYWQAKRLAREAELT